MVILLTIVALLTACEVSELPPEPQEPGTQGAMDIAGQAGRITTARYQQFVAGEEGFPYAPPHDVFEDNNPLVFQISKDDFKVGPDGVQFEATVDHQGGLVYKYGYINVMQDGMPTWQRYELTGTSVLRADGTASNWLRDDGSATLTFTTEEMQNIFERGENYVVAYSCKKHGRLGEWKCGCSDRSCARPYWMLQSFLVCGENQGIGYFEATGTSACLDPCQQKEDCAAGYGCEALHEGDTDMFCVNPEMKLQCQDTTACAVGEFCGEGQCKPLWTPQEGAPERCVEDAQCPIAGETGEASGGCLNNRCVQINPYLIGVSGGRELHVYPFACGANADCGGIYTCNEWAGSEKVCFQTALCTNNGDCKQGTVCEAGSCKAPLVGVAVCTGDADCGAGKVCDGGTCVAAPAPVVVAPAGPAPSCRYNIDCADAGWYACVEGVCKTKEEVLTGLSCIADTDCEAGQKCGVSSGSDIQHCIDVECTSDAQCSAAYKCYTDLGACMQYTKCTDDTTCPTGKTCNPATSFCEFPALPAAAAPVTCGYNIECTDAGLYACVSGTCKSKDEFYSILPACDPALGCAALETCTPIPNVGNRCLGVDCTTDADCAHSNYKCYGGVCQQYSKCSADTDCKDGQRCDIPSALCMGFAAGP